MRHPSSLSLNIATGIILFLLIFLVLIIFGQQASLMASLVITGLCLTVILRRIKYDKRPLSRSEILPIEEKILMNISHEFRTPLVSSQSYIDMLLAHKLGPLAPSQTKALETCQKNIRHLTGLIECLLDIGRVRKGESILKIESVHIPRFLQSLIEKYSHEFNTHQIRLTTNINLPFPIIEADSSRLHQAFSELFKNAIRFNIPSGEIVLTASDTPSHFEIAMANSSPPLSPEDLSRIFKPFYQIHQDETGKPKGLGMGLAIASEIIKLHGGGIRVAQDDSSRITFFVSLPKNLSVKRQTSLQQNTSPA